MARAHHFTRKQIAQMHLRANGRCEGKGCGAKLKTGEGEADHILPVALGGESAIENGQILCRPCHTAKTGEDVRRIRKSDRQRDKHSGAFKRGKYKRSGFGQSEPQRTATRPVNLGLKT